MAHRRGAFRGRVTRPTWRLEPVTRAALPRIALLGAVLTGLVAVPYLVMVRMPGQSWQGRLPPLSARQSTLRDELRAGVLRLAGDIGERNVDRYEALTAAAAFLEAALVDAGYRVERQSYTAFGRACDNLVVERRGTSTPEEIVVVGAHYDSVEGSAGANDNATGAIAVLALARHFAAVPVARTVRFVEFVNEEPPSFQSSTMGSHVYAQRCRDRGERVVAMLSLETMGYFSDRVGSQTYPAPALGIVYPRTGNFISLVGNVASAGLVREALGSFRRHAQFPSEGGAFPSVVPGVGWSDHSSFWDFGYPAVMITDTAPFRYPHYHHATDTPDKIDYDALARVVDGLMGVLADIAARR